MNANSRIIDVNDMTINNYLKFDKLILTFYAPWCGPCKALLAVYNELAETFHDVYILKINIDRSPSLTTQYQVESVPTLLYFKGGKQIKRYENIVTFNTLKQLLNQTDVVTHE